MVAVAAVAVVTVATGRTNCAAVGVAVAVERHVVIAAGHCAYIAVAAGLGGCCAAVAAGHCAYVAVAVATVSAVCVSVLVVVVSVVSSVAGAAGFVVCARTTARTVVVVSVAHARAAVGTPASIGRYIVVAAALPVAAMVADVHAGPFIIVVAIAVVVADGVVPGGAYPAYWTVEVVQCDVEPVLPIPEDIAEVGVAIVPINTIAIGLVGDRHEVVEVDLIDAVVLIGRQVEFIGHLVGEEPCTVACFVITDSLSGECACQNNQEGE